MVVVIAGLAVGCVGDNGSELGENEQHSESANRLAGNRLSENRLAGNRLAGGGLSTASVDVAAMAADEGARELLSYLMSCALPAGTELVSGDYVFPGQVGLAPRWLDRALTDDERSWVSSCILARVNAFGVTVSLSLRGTYGALRTSNAERAVYTLFEGGFWGNIFDGDYHACTSLYKSTDPQVSTMPLRACSVDAGDGLTECGFVYAGICEDVCGGAPTFYYSCGGTNQVLTTFLADSFVADSFVADSFLAGSHRDSD